MCLCVCVCVCVHVRVFIRGGCVNVWLSYQPEIFNITPSEMSFYGKNNAVLTGRNLGHVIGVRLQGHLDCSAKEWVKTVNATVGAKGLVMVPRRRNAMTTET